MPVECWSITQHDFRVLVHRRQTLLAHRHHGLTVDMNMNTICVVVINHYKCHKLQAFSRIRNHSLTVDICVVVINHYVTSCKLFRESVITANCRYLCCGDKSLYGEVRRSITEVWSRLFPTDHKYSPKSNAFEINQWCNITSPIENSVTSQSVMRLSPWPPAISAADSIATWQVSLCSKITQSKWKIFSSSLFPAPTPD